MEHRTIYTNLPFRNYFYCGISRWHIFYTHKLSFPIILTHPIKYVISIFQHLSSSHSIFETTHVWSVKRCKKERVMLVYVIGFKQY